MENGLMDKISTAFDLHQTHKFKMKNTSARYRLEKLTQMKKLILEKKDEISLALSQDFHKPKVETELTEIMPTVSMINLLEKQLPSWMADEKVKTPLLFKGSKSWIRREGKGCCLIISPWNYPFQLALYPLLTAFASGNTAILKPSEFTPHTNKIIALLVEQVFSTQEVQIFEGDVEVSTQLLKLPFDHIFFTGSTNVGKVVMEAASKHLASVALELGGKSPVIVDRGINFEEAGKKIAWAKLVNGGQTCVAPDYMLVHTDDESAIVDSMIKSIKSFYGTDWANEKDYNHIITKRHAERLNFLVQDAVEKGAEIKFGGEYVAESNIISPTILTGVNNDMKIMQEEIFGPILPIVTVNNNQEILSYINNHDNALAMYIFSDNSSNIDLFMNQTFNGGVTVNDALIGVGHPLLPFGGAGKSGIGKYHGKFGFDEFSNLRPVLKRNLDLGASYFFPPYTKQKEGVVSNLLKKFSGIF